MLFNDNIGHTMSLTGFACVSMRTLQYTNSIKIKYFENFD